MKWVNVNMRVLLWSMYKAQCWFLDPPSHLYIHLNTFWAAPSPHAWFVRIFFVSKTLHQHLSNNVGSSFLLKSYQTLNQWENSENNRRNIAFCFSYNVYKENARTFLQFICTWLEMHLIPRESSALRYFSLFLCLDFS